MNWHGIFPAATTQFLPDGALDIPGTLRHLDIMIESGVNGLILLGTVGECCSVEYDEKLEMLRAAVSHVNGRVPVVTGVAEYTTSLASRFAAAAEDIGVDGLMLLPAMVYKSDATETIAHFRSVSRAVDLPIICYNNPVIYGVDITPEMFDDLADEPRFVAIKESSEDCRRITDLKNRCGNRFAIFCGVDDLALESAMLGAVGWVSGLANAFPAESRLLWDLAVAGRYDEAVDVYRWFTPLLHLDTKIKLVQYIKLATAVCGLGSENVRPPRLPLVEPERSAILSIIQRAVESRPVTARRVVSAAS
jgi:4-hydroxy-tetrahydrodipicolinate synthase